MQLFWKGLYTLIKYTTASEHSIFLRNSEFAHKTNFGFRHQSPCTTSQDNVHHSSSSDQLAEQSTNQLIPLVLPGDDLNGRNPQGIIFIS